MVELVVGLFDLFFDVVVECVELLYVLVVGHVWFSLERVVLFFGCCGVCGLVNLSILVCVGLFVFVGFWFVVGIVGIVGLVFSCGLLCV